MIETVLFGGDKKYEIIDGHLVVTIPMRPYTIKLLNYIKDGLTSKEVANQDDVHYSWRTVDWHIESLCKMFDCKNRTQLVGKISSYL